MIEYAKLTPEDIVVRIEAINRGPDPAPLHILPHLWFRNTWCWGPVPGPEPTIHPGPAGTAFMSLVTDDSEVETLSNIPVHYRLGRRTLYGPSSSAALFTNNETNSPRVFGPGHFNRKPYVKDAFHRFVVNGELCINPQRFGTKAAIHYRFEAVPPGGSVVLRLRLSDDTELHEPLAPRKLPVYVPEVELPNQ